MSLVTQCPACDTCFKVVPDQLRLAQGWVRCGQCQEIFLATDRLVEARGPSVSTPSPLSPVSPVSPVSLEPPAPSDHSTPRIEPPAPAHNPVSTPTPRYVWDAAETSSTPRQGRVRTVFWSVAAGLALTALGLQAVHAWRHEVALHLPASRPALQTLCRWVDCQVEPVRRLSELSVESSELSQWGGTIYRMALVLRNRSDVPLMLPMLDVTLTDVRGTVIARKALSLSDFGVSSPTIGARQELSLQGHLNAGDANVAGYTIELFHP